MPERSERNGYNNEHQENFKTCFVDCACSGARSSRDRDGGRESAECLQIYAAWSVRKQNEHTEGFLLETCPHYLEFTDEKLKGEQGALYTMTPPLRKQKDTDLLWDGIQTRMLYLFSEGVKKRGLSMKRFVELTSENAARFYHRYPQKGCIQPGSDADLVLITEKENTKIHVENRKSNLDYTIYEGKQLEGKIQIVIKSGQTVYKNGKLNAEKGSGKYLV